MMIMRSKKVFLFVVLFGFFAEAKLTVDITHGNTEDITISFSQIDAENNDEAETAYEISKIVKSDLVRCGLFVVKKDIKSPVYEANKSGLGNWDSISSISFVTGSIGAFKHGMAQMKYRLWDVQAKKLLLEESITVDRASFRRVAHMIADAIYNRMTGEKGYFNSRIAYIAEFGGKKRIAVMDQDSSNRRFLTDGKHLVLTPRFSPNGQSIVYMSYAGDVPTIYIRNISKQTEEVLSDFTGIKSAPRFSPDGKSVLIARSIDGETDIYNVNLLNKERVKLTHKSAINTSASYSPDRKNIVFNSDRSGSPQLYIMTSYGRKQHRITFERGRYSSPSWSPRGDWIAFSKIVDGEFYIGVIRPDGFGERLLTRGYLVESPTWSPNGRMIVFTKQIKSRNGKIQSRLYSVDLTGSNERLIYTSTDASDPSWSQSFA